MTPALAQRADGITEQPHGGPRGLHAFPARTAPAGCVLPSRKLGLSCPALGGWELQPGAHVAVALVTAPSSRCSRGLFIYKGSGAVKGLVTNRRWLFPFSCPLGVPWL